MTTRTFFLAFLGMVVAGVTSTAYAQTTTSKKQHPVLSIVGILNCSACDLKKAEGAAAQCSIYGHQYSLLVELVNDPSGKRMEDLENRTYHIIRNDQSRDLAHEEHTKKGYKVKGKIYDKAQMLEVVTFEATK